MEKEWKSSTRQNISYAVNKEKSLQFLEFMIANGFNPNNHNGILELLKTVPDSISKYLGDYAQFLLSKDLEYNSLISYGIKGARGYIDKYEGIVVPKSLASDDYFFNHSPKVPYIRHGYSYPNIFELDSIIVNHEWTKEQLEQLVQTLYFPHEKFIGFVADKKDPTLEEKIIFYYSLLETMNNLDRDKYIIAHDTNSSEDKEFYLIKKNR